MNNKKKTEDEQEEDPGRRSERADVGKVMSSVSIDLTDCNSDD